MGFLLHIRLRGAEALRKAAPQVCLRCASGAPHGIFIVVFDFLCQFQAFHVFFMYVFDDLDESDDEISKYYNFYSIYNFYIYLLVPPRPYAS
ncbi:hypothetical protein Hanom_Chr14g01315591 [Helianthus anomalus]